MTASRRQASSHLGLVAFCQECQLQGLRVVGKTGRSREEITAVVDVGRADHPTDKRYLFGDL